MMAMILSATWNELSSMTTKQLGDRYIDIAREITRLSAEDTVTPELEAAQFELENLFGFYEIHRATGSNAQERALSRVRWQMWLHSKMQVRS